jgi:hypothetical protein
VLKGSAGGIPGSAGAGIVEGVVGMGISAVGGGVALAKERDKIEREHRENEKAINRAEAESSRSQSRDGGQGGCTGHGINK